MKAHRIETRLTENGTLHLKNLPFEAGEAVEVIILERHKHLTETNYYPLRGTVIRYEEPFAAPTGCCGVGAGS